MVVWQCAKSFSACSCLYETRENERGVSLNGDTGILYLISVDYFEKSRNGLDKDCIMHVIFPQEYTFRQVKKDEKNILFLAEAGEDDSGSGVGDQNKTIYFSKRINDLESELNGIRHSVSYRAGRMVTWAPRKARNFMRMLRTKGIRYTLVRLFGGRKRAAEYEKTKIPYRK